ncbi:MAG: TonB-dependent receptor [Acidobacteria bacterium]|nr:TonB-dependent receptor [Acidobacteriota bacterium]
MMKRMSSLLCFTVVLSLGWNVYGQSRGGAVSGVVKDASGAILPGVTITVRSTETGLTRSAVTNDEGLYRAPELAVGNYEVQAELSGFQTAVRTGINLTVGRELVIDFTLQVGELSDKVVVSGEAPMVDTTRATLSDVVEERQLHDLPLNTRDLTQLSLLGTGVVPVRSAGSGDHTSGTSKLKISIGGARMNMTGYLLDGTDITDSSRAKGIGGAAGALFGVETVREFQVMTNNFSAEHGRFAGGVLTLVTKSGTNEFHGSIFEFLRNDNLDARNFFDPGKPPEFKRNQFGFTLGGPIKKDRSFFFGSYEGFRESLGRTMIVTVPTEAVRQGILPNGRTIPIAPNVKPFLDLYPLPTPGARVFAAGGAEYIVAKTEPTRDDYWMAKIDHSFSDSNSFFARYTIDDSDNLQPTALPGGGNLLTARNQYITLEDKKIFSPTFLNILRFGFNRSVALTAPLPDSPLLTVTPIPNLTLGTVNPGGGISSLGRGDAGGANISNIFQYEDNLVLTRGRHEVKTGVKAARYQNNEFFDFNYNGVVTFGNLENFLRGTPRTWSGALPGSSTRRGFREWVVGLYLQDDLRLRSNLTVNLGLRYEVTTTPDEVNGIVANFRNPLVDADSTIGFPFFKNPSKRNFAPRLGLAWDPFGDGKTSVRSGFGVFHDTILFHHYALSARNVPPFNVRITLDNPLFPIPDTAKAVASRTPQLFEYEPQQPYMMQWNLTLQREVLPETTMTISYAGHRGVSLLSRRNINIRIPDILADGRKFFPAGRPRKNLNVDDIEYFSYSYSSFYHSMQLAVRKRYSSGLQLQGSYTWSRCVDDGSALIGGDFAIGNYRVADPDDIQGSNRGLCQHHVGQNFVFNYVYLLPVGRNLSGFARKVLDGWQLNGIVLASTGPPLPIVLGSLVDWDRDGNRADERPNLKSGASNNPVLGGPDMYFDPTAFELPTQGFRGNLGRNTLIGPGVATVDFSLTKNTDLGKEGRTLQFKAEFFNILNRANFGIPERSIFADASSALINGVGRITNTSTTSRQIQFGLKLLF